MDLLLRLLDHFRLLFLSSRFHFPPFTPNTAPLLSLALALIILNVPLILLHPTYISLDKDSRNCT